MTVELVVQSNMQVVVPVRLGRAVRGAPVINNPDIDDRGWLMNRPAGINSTNARGAMFGMMVGTDVTIELVREDIDGDTPLYVVAETVASPQFSVLSPATGLIPPDGKFRLHAIADTASGQKLEIRLGAADGPVLYEAEPHVFSPLTLNVTPHICTIHQAAGAPGTGVAPQANGAALDVARLRNGVNAVWQPAGIRFNFGATQNNTYFGYTRNDFPRWQSNTNVGSEGHLVSQNRVANTCNVYFVRYMDNSLGVGVNRDTVASEGWTQPGIIVGVEGSIGGGGAGPVSNRGSAGADLYQELINDLAHELGHYLSLQHVDNRNSPGRDDTFTRRCLMHPNNLMPGPGGNNVRFDDAGYGTSGGSGHRGCLITLKNLPNIATDSETIRARRRFNSPNLY